MDRSFFFTTVLVLPALSASFSRPNLSSDQASSKASVEMAKNNGTSPSKIMGWNTDGTSGLYWPKIGVVYAMDATFSHYIQWTPYGFDGEKLMERE